MGVQKSRKSLRACRTLRKKSSSVVSIGSVYSNKKKLSYKYKKFIFKKTDLLFIQNREADIPVFFALK